MTFENKNLSHQQPETSLLKIIQAKKEKISKRPLPYANVTYQLDLIDQLAQFELGRFLLERAGLNGFWTHYIISHPTMGRLSGLNKHGKPFTSLEDFMLNRAPICLATQQRFVIFKKELQKAVKEGVVFASIPCGLMADLLDLDYSKVSEFSLVGIDVDLESIEQASHLAKEKKVFEHCKFMQKDAWDLSIKEEFDLITSNGLNIYEPDDQKVIHLYQQFFHALKPHGRLITSFLTVPPGSSTPTEWNLQRINLQDAQLQKFLFADLLECKWQTFRSVEQSIDQLKKAGFDNIEIIYDEAHIFPTFIGNKL